jgi:hypothetical protein
MREVFLPQTLEELWEILDKKPGAMICRCIDLLVRRGQADDHRAWSAQMNWGNMGQDLEKRHSGP